MANVKTAISIKKPLFDEMESLAAEMEVSRSHVFALAARQFVDRNKSRKLLRAINAAHDEPPDAAEESLRARMKSKQRRLVKGRW